MYGGNAGSEHNMKAHWIASRGYARLGIERVKKNREVPQVEIEGLNHALLFNKDWESIRLAFNSSNHLDKSRIRERYVHCL